MCPWMPLEAVWLLNSLIINVLRLAGVRVCVFYRYMRTRKFVKYCISISYSVFR